MNLHNHQIAIEIDNWEKNLPKPQMHFCLSLVISETNKLNFMKSLIIT